MSKFSELLQQSFKSKDTEEWLDVHFTRPIGLVLALMYKRLHVHPNIVTVISMVLGVLAAVMFYYTDLAHNIAGVLLLMLANFHDSADGQLARLTNQRTQIGRFLDGAAGDVWFIGIYFFICLRLMPQTIPFTDVQWGLWPFVLCAISGIVCHGRQSALADYYRNIHLFFLKGKGGSELDSYRQQKALKDATPWKGNFWYRFYLENYCNYCKGQEQQTPRFQRFFQTLRNRFPDGKWPESVIGTFLNTSRGLMTSANVLTFNCRAIVLYISCLIDMPWLYPVVEIVIFTMIYWNMRLKHEHCCKKLYLQYLNVQ